MLRRLNPLITLGLLTVVLHAVLLFVVIPETSKGRTFFYNQDRFADGYDDLAENLVLGNGYRLNPDTARTLMREPGYPIVLAGLRLAFGNNFVVVKLSNMCLALATAWIMVLLAGRISNSGMLFIAPPLLFLFHPATLIAESRGGVETLFTFLVILFLLVLYTAMERSDWRYYALTGAVLGLAVLVRSTPMLFPMFLLGYLLVFERRRIPALKSCRNVAVMIVAMFAVLSPWIIRNYGLTGRFVPTASVLGVSAHAGEYICAHRSDHKPWFLLDHEAAQERGRLSLELGYRSRDDSPYYQSFYSTEDELRFSSYLAHRVLLEYERNPLLCAKCMGLNLFNFWFTGKTWAATAMNILVQLPYLVLAAIGTVLCQKTNHFKMIGPLVAFILYVMAVHTPILAQARYSVPLIPLLSILASFTLAALAKPANSAMVETIVERGDRPCSPTSVASLIGCGTEKQ